MIPDKFNIRVYGVVIHEEKVLLVHEKIRDFSFTKFPGGGVELGEGIVDALRREFREELNTEIAEYRHLYTTESFVRSAFNSKEQIISVYYAVTLNDYPEHGYFQENSDHFMLFEWHTLKALESERLTFPIDKLVLAILLKSFVD